MPRHAFLEISPEILLQLTCGRFEVVENPLPAGTRIVSCHVAESVSWAAGSCLHSGHTHDFLLVVEHASFAEVPKGAILPRLPPPSIRRIDADPMPSPARRALCPACQYEGDVDMSTHVYFAEHQLALRCRACGHVWPVASR